MSSGLAITVILRLRGSLRALALPDILLLALPPVVGVAGAALPESLNPNCLQADILADVLLASRLNCLGQRQRKPEEAQKRHLLAQQTD